MSLSERRTPAPVLPTVTAAAARRSLGLSGVQLVGGVWAERRSVNRAVTIPYGALQLEAAGNLDNFRMAARGGGHYRAETDDSGRPFAFLDSDVYKWLEAVGWTLSAGPDADLSAMADPVIDFVGRAQRADGYLNTFVQLERDGAAYGDLEWGHELYCLGHLVQAAIAWRRTTRDERLLRVAEAAVAHAESQLGPGGREAVDGHPGIEMALVELYRETGLSRYLEFARTLIERRGRGLLGRGRLGADYWQDRVPARTSPVPVGHAVRQVYFDCGVVDVAMETGDEELLASAVRRFDAMVASRTYLTGGIGSRHLGESFGDPYELPPDRAYAETCAAIGSVMLAHRLHLATGHVKYADYIERAAFNAVLAGLSMDGSHFFYSNPLQRRSTGAEVLVGSSANRRAPWFACACCPPNLMRFLASMPDLIATVENSTVHVDQYATAVLRAHVGSAQSEIRVETDYPWDGFVRISVQETSDAGWQIALRIPAWCEQAAVSRNGSAFEQAPTGEKVLPGPWHQGDTVELRLAMPPRLTVPDPRIDAVRGTVAIERGPIVYALESDDLPSGTDFERIAIDPTADPIESVQPASRRDSSELPRISVRLIEREADLAPTWPYRPSPMVKEMSEFDGRKVTATAIPYFAWGNRTEAGMRVWIPVSDAQASSVAVRRGAG